VLIALTLLPTLNLNPLPAKAAEAESSWTTLAPMPTPRGGFGLAVVDGKIYAIGGLNGNNLPISTTEEYNPQTDGWTGKMPMPTPRNGFAIAVYENKIYVIGGTVGNGYVGNNEVYDPASNTWETKTSMPTPRADLCADVVNDTIYLIGGKRYVSTAPFFNETNINEAYDPVNDSWTTKASIPMPVQGYASAVVNGKIYVMGGSLESLSLDNTLLTAANQVYDTQNNNWSLAPKLLDVNSYGAAAATQGFLAPSRIYCVGGYSSGEFSAKTEAYDLANNSWSTAESMPTPRAYLGVVVVNDLLYAIGGFDGANWLGVNEQYKPVDYGTIAPKVQITYPENKTYSDVLLQFTLNRGAQWIGYSLDNHANVTIQGETKLFSLSQGVHNVTVYANDSLGNMGGSNTASFTVDTVPPNIVITIPQNKSYDTTDIQLTFTVNEAVSYMAYSLDGQDPVKINGNVTLPALSNGSHRITIYATDEVGNAAQKTVSFNIAPFPVVLVAAAIALVTIALASGFLIYKRRKTGTTKKSSGKKTGLS
jgi:N-acetylneuraminic acid mutarotase